MQKIPLVVGLVFLGLGSVSSGRATEIDVDFTTSNGPVPLRLNQAANGWATSRWSQYYNDIGVEYRRADHYHNGYNPVRRRPDGGLWYDFAALDHVLFDATGGFNYKAYSTLDYSPACLTTEFLQNPITLQKASGRGFLTPAGTLMISGDQLHPTSEKVNFMPGPGWKTALYEVDRKGRVLGIYPPEHDFFVTPANHIVIDRQDGYSVLGPDRTEMARGPGEVLQEMDGKSLLVATGDPDTRHISQVDLTGKSLKTWDDPLPEPVVVMPSGLVAVMNGEVFLFTGTGKKSIQKMADAGSGKTLLTADPADSSGRFFAVNTAYDKDTKIAGTVVYAFGPDGTLLWKSDPVPGGGCRGAVATKDGAVIAGLSTELVCIGQDGVHWKVPHRGTMDTQLLSTSGMETVAARNYENVIQEFDARTGESLWEYGNVGDQSEWLRTPPKDMDGWEDLVAQEIKHFNKDLGLGWDRWEAWNEPTAQGPFWLGDWMDYAHLVEATMRGVERSDPTITMDAYDGSGWFQKLVPYLASEKVRLDGLSWHGYQVPEHGSDFSNLEEGAITSHMAVLKRCYPDRVPQLANTEWNIHPGHGNDMSNKYETGYFRAPFQAQMTYLMGKGGVAFSSVFAMCSDIGWPSGLVYASEKEIGGKAPEKGERVFVFSPAYNGARLWAMLPSQAAAVKNDFQPVTGKSSQRVNAIAAVDPQKGEYAMMVWNTSDNAPDATDQTVTLNFTFPNESAPLHVRHFIIDDSHSTYTAGFDKQWLEAAESGTHTTAELSNQQLVLKKDSMHAFFFTRDPLKANAGPDMTVEVHHPVRFNGSASTGLPAFYRWDVGVSGAPTFPDPADGPPSQTNLFGLSPTLTQGYDKPGKYTVTLRVSADGYHRETSTSTLTVNVVEDKTPPETPAHLAATCEKSDRAIYLQWDALNYARNPDVTGFTVYRKEGGKPWTKLTDEPLSMATSFVDEKEAEGVVYTYHVTATDFSGNESGPSNEVSAVVKPYKIAPPAPLNAVAKVVGDHVMQMKWENAPSLADAACIEGFNVYRRIAGGGWQKLTDRPTFYKRFYDASQNAATSDYCVTAVDNAGNESPQTAPVTSSP